MYGGWLLLTLGHARVPMPLLVVLGGIVIAWHRSLQHETIHGHPAGPRWLGWLLGAPGLSFWLPYVVYRDTHRRHHATPHLTDPAHDPEAPFGLVPSRGPRGRLVRVLEATQRTALGRFVLGPPLTVSFFLAQELGACVRGVAAHRRAWVLHALATFPVLLWLVGVAGIPLWKYLLAFVYPGASLTLLRSFVEHRADREPHRRTTVVEAGLFFRILFLNNNLHVMHHRAPHAPWFELPDLWATKRGAFVATSPELVHDGYLRVVGQAFVSPLTLGDER